LQTKVVGNLVSITICLTPYIKVGIWFHPVLMSLDPVEASPQSGCVHATCKVGNDINIVIDSSPLQELSFGSIHPGDGSFVITALNDVTGRCNIVERAEMVQELIDRCNAEQLYLHQA
jgi:Na+/citrate or Na+/malate symporter